MLSFLWCTQFSCKSADKEGRVNFHTPKCSFELGFFLCVFLIQKMRPNMCLCKTHSCPLIHLLFLGNQQPLEQSWSTEITENANDKVATHTHTHTLILHKYFCITSFDLTGLQKEHKIRQFVYFNVCFALFVVVIYLRNNDPVMKTADDHRGSALLFWLPEFSCFLRLYVFVRFLCKCWPISVCVCVCVCTRWSVSEVRISLVPWHNGAKRIASKPATPPPPSSFPLTSQSPSQRPSGISSVPVCLPSPLKTSFKPG